MIREPWEASTRTDIVDVMLDVDVQTYLVDDLLTKMDIATMASSLEARSPLLDHEWMEFTRVAARPAPRCGAGEKKVALRAALRGWVPDEVLDAPKRGFRVPLAEWFRGELREFVARRPAGPGDARIAAGSTSATCAGCWTATGSRWRTTRRGSGPCSTSSCGSGSSGLSGRRLSAPR